MSRIPSTPMHFDHKTILIASEETYGQDEALSFIACRMWDVQASWLEVEEKELPYVLPHMGNRPAVFLKRRMTLSGKLALVGSGGAVDGIPAIDPFFRACGAVRSTVPPTPEATVGDSATAMNGAVGRFSHVVTEAYAGVFDRLVTLTCTVAGDSGEAVFTLSTPAVEYLPAVEQAGIIISDGDRLDLIDGAAIVPIVTQPFVVGDSFTIGLTAAGSRYRPLSDRAAHGSAALHILLPDPSAVGGKMRRYAMLGTRGQIKAAGQVDDYPYFEVELTSLFAMPALANGVEPDFGRWPDPLEISTANTPLCRLFGHDLVCERFGWDAGNDVSLVQRVGRQAVRINDRKSTASLTFEEPGLGEFDLLTAAASHQRGRFLFQHGEAAGEVVRFTAPTVQLGRPAQSESQKDLVTETTMRLLPADGDDEWEWFFSA